MTTPTVSSSADRPPAVGAAPRPVSAWGRWRRRLSISGLIGLATVIFWLLVAAFGPLLAPHGVGAIVADDSFASFSTQFPLGSDYLGRDVLSRILYGARYTIGLALAAAVLASTTGTALGLAAAVTGRWIDETMSRLLDALTCIPSKIFALVMVAGFGSSVPLLMLTAALTYLPGAYRIARSLAVNLNVMEYVEVARARGEGRAHIACFEILPNMIHPMLADFGLRFVFVVLLLSGLSFLGLGVQPPAADLGSLVRENISGLAEGAPAVLMPALAIATLTIGVNLLIDSLPGRARRFAQGALR
jgi:peptide/nickel transport system permease protein